MANEPIKKAGTRKCYWCFKEKYLLPKTVGEHVEKSRELALTPKISGFTTVHPEEVFPDGICGGCSEDPEYIEHLARIARAERINAKAKRNS